MEKKPFGTFLPDANDYFFVNKNRFDKSKLILKYKYI